MVAAHNHQRELHLIEIAAANRSRDFDEYDSSPDEGKEQRCLQPQRSANPAFMRISTRKRTRLATSWAIQKAQFAPWSTPSWTSIPRPDAPRPPQLMH